MALIALGVTGGIGAYKAVEIARGLQQQGHEVSRDHDALGAAVRRAADLRGDHAPRRWSPTSGRPATNADIEHIAIASSIDLLLVAPATANTLGKFAHGIADDFLVSLYLATTAPVVLAPAMNTQHVRAPGGGRQPASSSSAAACASSSPAPATWRAAGSARGASPSREDVVAFVQQVLRARRDDADRPSRAGDGRTDLREHRSRALHRQPGQRPDGRGAGRRGAAARGAR